MGWPCSTRASTHWTKSVGWAHTQIGLGLLAILQPGWGLIYFALGFGLGHIGYGLLMHNRYERPDVVGNAAAQSPVSA